MQFKKGVKRAEISNAVDNFVGGTVGQVNLSLTYSRCGIGGFLLTEE